MILSIIFVLTICGTVSAADRNVGPGYTYANISDAVNAASPGDNIYVHDNNGSSYTYNESVVVNKENLSIIAKGNVTVKSRDSSVSTFKIECMANGTAIRGFKITGATNSSGISFYGSIYNIIQDNTIYGNYGGIRMLGGVHNTIINNTFSNEGGISVTEDWYTNITGNTIEKGTSTTLRCGIDSQSSDHIIITDNIINNCPTGIWIDASDFSNIFNNILNNTVNGIHIQYAKNCEITGNTVINNQVGILLESTNMTYLSANNTIDLNIIQNNTVGISLKGSSGNFICQNIINNNSIGILITDTVVERGYPDYGSILKSSDNTILANDIYNNGDGISFAAAFSTPSGNQVNFNRIVNNTSWGLVNYSDENVDATYNWWGSNSSPSGKIYGSHVKYDPWLVLKVYALPASIYPGGFSTITAEIRVSDGSSAYGKYRTELNVLFSNDKGSIDSPKTTDFGLAKSVLFVPIYSNGTANVSVVVDAQTVNVQVPIKPLVLSKILIKNLNKGTVHYLYYVKIIKPDGQITTKTFRGDLRGYRSACINLGKLPQGSKIQITSYITNKNRFRRTVSVSNTIIKPKWSWSYQWIYQRNVRASPGRLWRNPVIRSTTIRI